MDLLNMKDNKLKEEFQKEQDQMEAIATVIAIPVLLCLGWLFFRVVSDIQLCRTLSNGNSTYYLTYGCIEYDKQTK